MPVSTAITGIVAQGIVVEQVLVAERNAITRWPNQRSRRILNQVLGILWARLSRRIPLASDFGIAGAYP